MGRANFIRWLRMPSLAGIPALACAVAALGTATLIRGAVAGLVSGCEFTPFLPAVLLCAVLIGWWQASAVALGSVAVVALLFDCRHGAWLTSPCFDSAAAIFLASSAGVIALGVLIRTLLRRGADDAGSILFSLERGEVWASWYGHPVPVRLGDQQRVSAMMQDFLAQEELGRRLSRNQPRD